MSRINILISGDDGMYSGMELVIYSLLTHNKNVGIYVCTMSVNVDHDDGTGIHYEGLTEDHKRKLRFIVNYLDRTSDICFIDPYEPFMKYLSGSVNDTSHFSPFAAFRLMADKLFPHIDHILHLDCDAAITGDIRPVYFNYCNQDTDYAAYMNPDTVDEVGEMVSGVLLLNLAHIRRTGFLEKARENYKKNLYVYPDQYALRDAGTAARFPSNFGYCEDLFEAPTLPIIIHFTNKIGPKIYTTSKEKFYRMFSFLSYVNDGLKLIDTITHK